VGKLQFSVPLPPRAPPQLLKPATPFNMPSTFHLILVELAVLVLLLALLLECDDDKADKDVDHEEGDDDDVDKVEDGDALAVVVYRTIPLVIRVNTRVHQTDTHRNTHKNTGHSLARHRPTAVQPYSL